MIIYNIRANGPWEYDKFVLNSTQLYNEVKKLKEDDAIEEMKTISKNLDSIIEKEADENTSIVNRLMLRDLKKRGMIVGY